MSTRLILIRHAASQHKEQGVTGGLRSCQGLTDLGREQAARLRDRLLRSRSIPAPANFYSSMVPRAIETAHILAAGFGLDPRVVHQDCDLCSWHIPVEHDCMSVKEYQERFAVAGGGVFRPFETGSESWSELVGRTGRALWTIAQRHQGETTLVVMHAETIQASLIAFGDLPLMLPFELQIANASLTEWTTDEDTAAWPHARWTLVRFNDTAHLESVAS